MREVEFNLFAVALYLAAISVVEEKFKFSNLKTVQKRID